jgi:hypothetical protein
MIKPIVFKEQKRRRVKVEPPLRAKPAKRKPPKNPREQIRGIPVGSSYEANVADALEALGWDYWYQYSVAGGRRLRGGMVVDFIVWTRPAATPIWVNGRYWHARRSETDKLQQARLKGLVRFPVTDALEMFDEDCETYDDAYQFLLSKIGKG